MHMLLGIYYSPEGPNFRPFRSTGSRFRLTGNFSIGGCSCGGATKVKPRLEMVKVLTGMYYSPENPNFRPFHSTGHRFRVTANFSCGGGADDNGETNVVNGESGHVQWYVLLTSGPKFLSVSHYRLPFSSYRQF